MLIKKEYFLNLIHLIHLQIFGEKATLGIRDSHSFENKNNKNSIKSPTIPTSLYCTTNEGSNTASGSNSQSGITNERQEGSGKRKRRLSSGSISETSSSDTVVPSTRQKRVVPYIVGSVTGNEQYPETNRDDFNKYKSEIVQKNYEEKLENFEANIQMIEELQKLADEKIKSYSEQGLPLEGAIEEERKKIKQCLDYNGRMVDVIRKQELLSSNRRLGHQDSQGLRMEVIDTRKKLKYLDKYAKKD